MCFFADIHISYIYIPIYLWHECVFVDMLRCILAIIQTTNVNLLSAEHIVQEIQLVHSMLLFHRRC